MPSGLKIAGKSSTTVSLSWTASTDNVGVAGYEIFRNGDKIGNASTTSFKDTGLIEETSYKYTIKAFDDSDNFSAISNEIIVETSKETGGDPEPEPNGDKPYSTNPTFGKKVSDPITIDGVNEDEWSDDMLIAIDMAGDDPRTLGDNCKQKQSH